MLSAAKERVPDARKPSGAPRIASTVPATSAVDPLPGEHSKERKGSATGTKVHDERGLATAVILAPSVHDMRCSREHEARAGACAAGDPLVKAAACLRNSEPAGHEVPGSRRRRPAKGRQDEGMVAAQSCNHEWRRRA